MPIWVMRRVFVERSPDWTPQEGTYYDPASDWTVIDATMGNVEVYIKDTSQMLASVLRHAIPLDLCELALKNYMQVGKQISTNRGTAAGQAHRPDVGTRYQRGATAHSGILGYMDSTHYARPCRLTAFSKNHFEKYAAGLPFVRAIDACFAACAPAAYEKQRVEAMKSEYHIKDTAFSTVTVNYTFRTSLHRDRGDFREGFGNLVVCSKDVTGGWVMFPEYKLAIVPATGDFIAMDVHQWHCNSPIEVTAKEGYRLSFVCYLRSGLLKCPEAEKRSTMGLHDVTKVCERIFESLDDRLPERRSIGVSPKGIEWWEYESEKLRLRYYHKRYTLWDKQKSKTIHNLYPALEYALGSKDE